MREQVRHVYRDDPTVDLRVAELCNSLAYLPGRSRGFSICGLAGDTPPLSRIIANNVRGLDETSIGRKTAARVCANQFEYKVTLVRLWTGSERPGLSGSKVVQSLHQLGFEGCSDGRQDHGRQA